MRSPSSSTCGVAVTVLCLLGGGSLLGQQPARAVQNPCPTCRIVISAPIRVGRPDDAASIGLRSQRFVILPTGDIVAGPGTRPHEVLRFDSTGRFRGLIGAEGAGPGEFRAVDFLAVDKTGRLHVFDRGTARVTILRQDYTLDSSIPLGARILPFAPVPGGVIVNGSLGSPGAVGQPLHFFDLAGTRVRSFGGTGIPTIIDSLLRWVGPADDGVWAIGQYAQRPERWNSKGELLQTIDVTSFRVPRPGGQRNINGVWQSGDVVWMVASRHTDPGNALSPELRGRGTAVWPDSVRDRFGEGTIAVFDAKSGALLAETTIPGFYAPIPFGGGIVRSREDPSGDVYHEVRRLRLVR